MDKAATVQLYSKEDQKLVDCVVMRDPEPDDVGKDHDVIRILLNGNIYRFSPNTTEDELKVRVADINKENQ